MTDYVFISNRSLYVIAKKKRSTPRQGGISIGGKTREGLCWKHKPGQEYENKPIFRLIRSEARFWFKSIIQTRYKK